MASFDLITADDLKEALGLGTTSEFDTLIDTYVTAASRDAERRMMRDIETVQRIEFYDGKGLDAIVLRQGPITDVSQGSIVVEEVAYGGETSPEYTELEDTKWVPEGLASDGHVLAGRIVRVDGNVFKSGRRNWRVTYTGGLAVSQPSVPADIQQMTIELATVMFNLREAHGLVRRDQGEMSIDTIPSANIEAALEARFARYRMVGL